MKIKNTLLSWLITCFGGSILLLIGFLLMSHSDDNSETMAVVLVYGALISLVASIPAFILYHLLGTLLYRNMENMVAKVMLTVYAIFAPLITLWLAAVGFIGERHLFERGNNDVLTILLPYMITFAVCVWLFGNKGKEDRSLIPETEDGYSEIQDDFPRQTVTLFTLIVLLTGCWSLFMAVKYWKYYHTPDKIMMPLIFALNLAGVILLCTRKTAGWLLSAVLSACFALTPFLFLGKTIVNRDQGTLKAIMNPQWVLFVILDVAALVLILLPGMRRFFKINNEKLGAVLIGGVLLAVALFFARL